jgi:uncharacterized membrane protein
MYSPKRKTSVLRIIAEIVLMIIILGIAMLLSKTENGRSGLGSSQ